MLRFVLSLVRTFLHGCSAGVFAESFSVENWIVCAGIFSAFVSPPDTPNVTKPVVSGSINHALEVKGMSSWNAESNLERCINRYGFMLIFRAFSGVINLSDDFAWRRMFWKQRCRSKICYYCPESFTIIISGRQISWLEW